MNQKKKPQKIQTIKRKMEKKKKKINTKEISTFRRLREKYTQKRISIPKP
jgi:hypothetical protein